MHLPGVYLYFPLPRPPPRPPPRPRPLPDPLLPSRLMAPRPPVKVLIAFLSLSIPSGLPASGESSDTLLRLFVGCAPILVRIERDLDVSD